MDKDKTNEKELGQSCELHIIISFQGNTIHNTRLTDIRPNKHAEDFCLPHDKYSTIYQAYNNGTHVPVHIADILFFCFKGERSYIKTKNSKIYSLRTTDFLNKISQALDPLIFYKVGRSHIINFNAIKTIRCIDKGKVEIFITSTSDIITVSRPSKKKFLEWYHNRLINEED